MQTDLDGKVVVVTGASTGFGRGIATRLAAEGALIVVGDIQEAASSSGFDEEPELTTTQLIEKRGGKAIYCNCNVTNRKEVAALIAVGVERFGRLDIMINNAGIYRGGKLLHEFDEADLDLCYEVNVKGNCSSPVRRHVAG